MAHKPECDRRLRPLVRGQPTKTSKVYYFNKQTGRRDLPIPTWRPERKEISKKAPPSNKPMKIFVKFPAFVERMGGQTIDVVVTPSETAQDLKRKIHAMTGFPPAVQRLIFKGIQLEPERSLHDCFIVEGSIVMNVVQQQQRAQAQCPMSGECVVTKAETPQSPPVLPSGGAVPRPVEQGEQPSDSYADIDDILSTPDAERTIEDRLKEIGWERLYEYADKHGIRCPPKEMLAKRPPQFALMMVVTRIMGSLKKKHPVCSELL